MTISIAHTLSRPRSSKALAAAQDLLGDWNEPAIGSAEDWVTSKVREAAANGDPICELVTITPAVAKALLRNNPHNRNVSEDTVRKYARNIRDGAFVLNGETIIVADDGLLNDGQHRLSAVVHQNASIRSFVVFGVPRGSRNTLDVGVTKTNAHFMTMDELPDPSITAAAVRIILNYEQKSSLGATRDSVETLRRYAADPSIQKSNRPARAVYHVLGSLPSLWYALHYLTRLSYGEETAQQFFELLASGLSLTERHPVHMLRQRLLQNQQAKAKLPPHEIAAITIKAINAFAARRAVNALRWSDAQEAFPRLPEPLADLTAPVDPEADMTL